MRSGIVSSDLGICPPRLERRDGRRKERENDRGREYRREIFPRRKFFLINYFVRLEFLSVICGVHWPGPAGEPGRFDFLLA